MSVCSKWKTQLVLLVDLTVRTDLTSPFVGGETEALSAPALCKVKELLKGGALLDQAFWSSSHTTGRLSVLEWVDCVEHPPRFMSSRTCNSVLA
jgi:hypothetical protein